MSDLLTGGDGGTPSLDCLVHGHEWKQEGTKHFCSYCGTGVDLGSSADTSERDAEHQRLQSAIVEKARIMLEISEAVGHVCLDVEDTLEATRRLVQFEAEHGIGEK